MRNNILIATGIYPPSVVGPATYSFFLYHELPKMGLQTLVYSFDEVRKLPKVIRHIQYFLGVLRRGFGVRMIYAQDPVSVGLPALFAARLLRKPFIIRIAGDYAWEQATQRFDVHEHLDTFAGKDGPYPFFVRILKRVQAYVATRADVVIVPSQYLKQVLVKWGVKPQNIRVIYNSVDVPFFDTKANLRKKFNLEGCVIFSAGRLVQWKGFNALIEIMPEILKKDKGCSLFIAGDGPERPTLKRLIAKYKLEDCVFLVGKLPREEVLEFVKASDIFVLNTAYEGFSHVALEVMAVGTPLITTRAGGNTELIEHMHDGLLVEYNDHKALRDAIVTIKDDPIFAQTLVQNARKKLERFSKEKMIKELVAQLGESL